MADSEENKDQRQLPASERKLQQAREEGRVARSRDTGHAAALIAALATALVYGPHLGREALALVRSTLRFDRAQVFDPARMGETFGERASAALLSALPMLITPILAALAAGLVVGGLVLSLKPLQPDLNKMNPLTGLSRIFSLDSATDLAKLALVAAAVGVVGYLYVSSRFDRIAMLASLPLVGALAEAGWMLAWGCGAIALVLVVAAAVDAPLQIFRFRSKMKMTFEEVKREHKESEGDPMIRARRRERQRALARGRMFAAVPTADVVVTNPTHYAVALKYDDGAMGAPRVVAKGTDLVAARIRELAREAGVPLLEAPPLARALHAHVEIDREIPAALYSAVAQVLAYVFQLNRMRAGAAAPAVPNIEVPAGLDPQEDAR